MMQDNIQLLPVNLLQVIFCVVSLLGVILIWHLHRYRGLAYLLVYYALLMILNLFEELGISKPIYLITPIFTLLIGPALFFYISILVKDRKLRLSSTWPHFLPAIITIPWTEFVEQIIVVATISQLIYLSICFKLVQRYHQSAKATRSDADKFRLNWLVKILIIYAVFAVIDLVRLNLKAYLSIDIRVVWYFFDVLVFFLIGCFLLTKAIKNPTLFDEMIHYEENIDQSSTLKNEKEILLASNIFQEIDSAVIEHELYKKPRLSVQDISHRIGLNVKDISWAINIANDKNFCDYINQHRVEAIKHRLKNRQLDNFSLLDIAFEAGFSSKSTFNAFFKKVVGQTPSQYQKNINRNSS